MVIKPLFCPMWPGPPYLKSPRWTPKPKTRDPSLHQVLSAKGEEEEAEMSLRGTVLFQLIMKGIVLANMPYLGQPGPSILQVQVLSMSTWKVTIRRVQGSSGDCRRGSFFMTKIRREAGESWALHLSWWTSFGLWPQTVSPGAETFLV